MAIPFPHALIHVIVTAIGGKDSCNGAARFDQDLVALKPDFITLDSALNDRRIGLENARRNWVDMIEKAAKARANPRTLLSKTSLTVFRMPQSWAFG